MVGEGSEGRGDEEREGRIQKTVGGHRGTDPERPPGYLLCSFQHQLSRNGWPFPS